jgi:hypothetical protein
MNQEELKQEALTLAHQLGDPDGLEYSTIMYVSSELSIPFREAQMILTESLFDME